MKTGAKTRRKEVVRGGFGTISAEREKVKNNHCTRVTVNKGGSKKHY